MRPNPFLLAALCLLAAAPVQARQTPNPEGRGLLDPDGRVVSPGRPWGKPAGAQVQSFNLVPLPAGAVQLDSTWYDLQDMGSLGRRVAIDGGGRVHVTWQDDLCDASGLCPPNINLPQPFPQRGMVYAFRDPGGSWTLRGKVSDPSVRNCCVTELFGGFGTLALTPDGRVAVSQHMNEEGCDLRGNFYLQQAVGGTTWKDQLTPISGGDSYLFPQVVALPDGRFIVLGEVPIGGSYAETQDFRVSVFADGNRTFSCPIGWQGGTWKAVMPLTLFKGNQGAFPSIAVAAGGKVGIAVGDFGGNVFLVESSNGSFDPGTVTIRNLTNYTDGQITAADSTSAQYRPYVHTSIAYQDTTPHVVWSELQARREGGQIFFYDHRSRIVHWSSQTGARVVYQVVPGQADRFDDVDQGLSGPLGGFNTLAVDWPQVGFSPDGAEVYVLFSWMSDAHVDPTADMALPGIVTGVGFGEIVACVSRGGAPFTAPQNLTNTPDTDERFFSIPAVNPGGRAHVLFQASQTNQAGVVQIADRGTVAQLVLRRIAYMEPVLQGSLVGVEDGARAAAAPALRAWPNPARGAVSFRLGQARGAAAVQVYSVDGRLVARVPVGAGGEARWDGTDARGKAAPGGLYFARPEGPASSAVKFMLLH